MDPADQDLPALYVLATFRTGTACRTCNFSSSPHSPRNSVDDSNSHPDKCWNKPYSPRNKYDTADT